MTGHDGKIIMMIGDGMGGRDVPSLGSKTCLEAANTPALDALARGGASAIMYLANPGQPVGSDTAHMALLGYDPHKYYRGRGPFEAMGVGLDMQPGDVAFRCNFATLDASGIIIDRRAGRPQSGTDEFAAAVMDAFKDGIDGVQVFFRASVEHRAALVLRGDGLSYHLTDVDPHAAGVKPALCGPAPTCPPDEVPKAKHTADVVNQFVERAAKVLDAHPVNKQRAAEGLPKANAALPRGAGEAVHIPPFSEMHGGLRGAMIVEVDLVRGLGDYAKMDVLRVAGATGRRDTDEIAIAKAVAQNVPSYDFLLCNIKAPDLGGHDRDPEQKVQAIEKVDRAVAYLLDSLDWEATVIMVGADHCTPIVTGDHTGDAVPVVFYGQGVRRDLVQTYSERAAAAGGVGQIAGADALTMLRNFVCRLDKFGA
jgi:2,3-bisphosphoglycerate-independent phosphoglycerate mutase